MAKQIDNYFPTVNSTVAYYDPYNFSIYLNKVERANLGYIMKSPLDPKNIEHIKTLTHEARHFADHAGTLWGQRYLLSYLKAMNARIQSKLENFPFIVEYCNQVNQMFYVNYYTEEYNYFPIDRMEKRWRWSSTTGLRFASNGTQNEEAPIPFIHFAAWDHTPLIRVPLSITSLLETNAMNEEFKLQMAYIHSLENGEQAVQLKFFEQESLINLIYNQDMAVYNVAVHLTSNVLGISDIALAFDISSQVATLALNLPDKFVKALPIAKSFEIAGKRNTYMLENNEYGFIFYLLLMNYQEEFKKTRQFSIDTLLNCSKLPSSNEITEVVLAEMKSIRDSALLEEDLSDLFSQKLDQGVVIFKERGLCSEKKPLFAVLTDNNIVPHIFCNDMDIPPREFHPSELKKMRPIKSLTLADWHNLSDFLGDMLLDFYNVRGV